MPASRFLHQLHVVVPRNTRNLRRIQYWQRAGRYFLWVESSLFPRDLRLLGKEVRRNVLSRGCSLRNSEYVLSRRADLQWRLLRRRGGLLQRDVLQRHVHDLHVRVAVLLCEAHCMRQPLATGHGLHIFLLPLSPA